MRMIIYGMIAGCFLAAGLLLWASAQAGKPHPVGPAHIHPLPLGTASSIPIPGVTP